MLPKEEGVGKTEGEEGFGFEIDVSRKDLARAGVAEDGGRALRSAEEEGNVGSADGTEVGGVCPLNPSAFKGISRRNRSDESLDDFVDGSSESSGRESGSIGQAVIVVLVRGARRPNERYGAEQCFVGSLHSRDAEVLGACNAEISKLLLEKGGGADAGDSRAAKRGEGRADGRASDSGCGAWRKVARRCVDSTQTGCNVCIRVELLQERLAFGTGSGWDEGV